MFSARCERQVGARAAQRVDSGSNKALPDGLDGLPDLPSSGLSKSRKIARREFRNFLTLEGFGTQLRMISVPVFDAAGACSLDDVAM